MMDLRHTLETEGKVEVAKAAHKWEVTRDTIKRDLDRLRWQFDMDIVYDRVSNSYVYDAPKPDALSASEFAALQIAAELFRRIAGTRFERALELGLEKVRRLLPPEVSLSIERDSGAQTISVDLLRGERDLVTTNVALLAEAITGKTSVRCNYFSAYKREQRERRLDPYHLLFHGDAWYCIAYCHDRRDVRTFAVQRMERLHATNNRFKPQADFVLETYLEGAFNLETGEPEQLEVWFSPSAAIYVCERRWHPSQHIEPQPDGSIIFRANVVCGGEVMRWLLQYGADAEVRHPEGLRAQMAAQVAGMGARYSPEG